VVLGATGQVGTALLSLAKKRHVVGLTRDQFNLEKLADSQELLRKLNPSFIINAAAYTAVDKAETESDIAYQVNGHSLQALGRLAKELDVPVLHFSTDYVFAGDKLGPYSEEDTPGPVSVYGKSKLLGEQVLQREHSKSIILRVAWVFGPTGRNFVKTISRLARERDELRVVSDQTGCPTSALQIAETVYQIVDLALAGQFEWGTYHFSGQPACTWHQFAEAVVATEKRLGFPVRAEKVVAISTSEYPTPAKRPANSVLDDSKLRQTIKSLPDSWQPYLEQALVANRPVDAS
jgi:dTDP-4-dehydrorhamnose reductase